MTLSSSIIKNMNNGYVVVKIGTSDRNIKYYKVPENKADEFQSEYKKNSKKNSLSSTFIMLAAVIAALVPTALLTKKVDNNTKRTLINVGAGVAGGIMASAATGRVEQKSYLKLLNKYNAEPVENV